MKKHVFAVLLSVLLVFALSFTALAADNPTVTVETKADAVKAGDEVTLEVKIANNPGFTNFEWNIVYDHDRLELTEITTKRLITVDDEEVYVPYMKGIITTNTNKKTTGGGYINNASNEKTVRNGILFLLTFKVKEAAPAGEAEVQITSERFKSINKEENTTIEAEYVPGIITVEGTGGATEGGDSTGGNTTGGNTTGGTTTGGNTTGGTTTGGNTTGGTTTGGSTTGGTTTGGNTTGGSTTGGSTTGGSTTGGNTTGGTTTGGSTTGGNTTGGTTTGGNTTGGTTTGGNTTGGSTTGGSTTGGSTTGGSTTGGSTTGGSTTGGTETGDTETGIAVKPFKVDEEYYSVSGQTVTVSYKKPCKVGYYNGTKYVAIEAKENTDGSYSFTAPEGVTEVILVIKGDVSCDGEVKGDDITQLKAAFLQKRTLTAEEKFAGDITGDGDIKGDDITQLKAAFLQKRALTWDTKLTEE